MICHKVVGEAYSNSLDYPSNNLPDKEADMPEVHYMLARPEGCRLHNLQRNCCHS